MEVSRTNVEWGDPPSKKPLSPPRQLPGFPVRRKRLHRHRSCLVQRNNNALIYYSYEIEIFALLVYAPRFASSSSGADRVPQKFKHQNHNPLETRLKLWSQVLRVLSWNKRETRSRLASFNSRKVMVSTWKKISQGKYYADKQKIVLPLGPISSDEFEHRS